MHRPFSRRLGSVCAGLTLLAAVVAWVPAPAIAADEPPPVPPPAFATATATPYVAQPGYAGAYNIPQGYFVSLTDPDPFRAFGCATGDTSCAAPPPAPTPPPAP